jgi:hypothetical protein
MEGEVGDQESRWHADDQARCHRLLIKAVEEIILSWDTDTTAAFRARKARSRGRPGVHR